MTLLVLLPRSARVTPASHVALVSLVIRVLRLPLFPPVPPDEPDRVYTTSGYPSEVRIYTKTGDDGTTGLLYGGRAPKDDPAVEAYGSVDEAVAHLGLARALSSHPPIQAILVEAQRDLFVVGADLATNPDQRGKLRPGMSLVTGSMIENLERIIDETVAEHPLPQEFIVPGANAASAALDMARTAIRRAERRALQLRHEGREVNPEALRYLNRLSDLVFVLARWEAGGTEEPSRRS